MKIIKCQTSKSFIRTRLNRKYLPSLLTHRIKFCFSGLSFHRGGCIICVDYSTWSKQPYIELLKIFDPISEILYEELLLLIQNGINPNDIFMFGFSYGGQIASKIGRLLKPQYNINKIDSK